MWNQVAFVHAPLGFHKYAEFSERSKIDIGLQSTHFSRDNNFRFASNTMKID